MTTTTEVEPLFRLHRFEIATIFLAVLVADRVTHNGESTWFEGLQLLAVYAVPALTFHFVA